MKKILTSALLSDLSFSLYSQNILRFVTQYGSVVSFRFLFKAGSERAEPRGYVFVEYSSREVLVLVLYHRVGADIDTFRYIYEPQNYVLVSSACTPVTVHLLYMYVLLCLHVYMYPIAGYFRGLTQKHEN